MPALASDIDMEKSQIEDLIEKNQESRVVAEEEIKCLQKESYDLKRRLNDTISLFNRLNGDILSEIFLFVCAEGQIEALIGKLPAPFLLGRICHRWREVAWNTPRLWCEIILKFDKLRHDAQQDLLEEWIQRSKDCQIELLIVHTPSDKWEPPAGTFSKVLESCSRWEKLTIYHYQSFCSELLTRGCQFLSLGSINVLSSTHMAETPETTRKWALNYPPQLRQLHIDSLANNDFEINWASLSSLGTEITVGLSTDEARPITMDILASCSSLSSLSCSVVWENRDLALTFVPGSISLPSLKQIDVKGISSAIIRFMNLVTVTSLESLSLEVQDIGDTEDGAWEDALANLAQRSSFNLHYLALVHGDFTDRHMVDLLEQLSPSNAIRSLRVVSSNPEFRLSDRFITQITVDLDGEGGREKERLPMLKSLEYYGNISCSLHSISRMLKSRSAYEKNQVTGSTAIPPTRIDINYNNRGWFKKQHPNLIRQFYREMEEFSSEGRLFTLEWGNGEYVGLHWHSADDESDSD